MGKWSAYAKAGILDGGTQPMNDRPIASLTIYVSWRATLQQLYNHVAQDHDLRPLHNATSVSAASYLYQRSCGRNSFCRPNLQKGPILG
jgi:hypothetical protein